MIKMSKQKCSILKIIKDMKKNNIQQYVKKAPSNNVKR